MINRVLYNLSNSKRAREYYHSINIDARLHTLLKVYYLLGLFSWSMHRTNNKNNQIWDDDRLIYTSHKNNIWHCVCSYLLQLEN